MELSFPTHLEHFSSLREYLFFYALLKRSREVQMGGQPVWGTESSLLSCHCPLSKIFHSTENQRPSGGAAHASQQQSTLLLGVRGRRPKLCSADYHLRQPYLADPKERISSKTRNGDKRSCVMMEGGSGGGGNVRSCSGSPWRQAASLCVRHVFFSSDWLYLWSTTHVPLECYGVGRLEQRCTPTSIPRQ